MKKFFFINLILAVLFDWEVFATLNHPANVWFLTEVNDDSKNRFTTEIHSPPEKVPYKSDEHTILNTPFSHNKQILSDKSVRSSTINSNQPENYQNDYFTGDWKGWRPWLDKKGFVISSVFITEILGNPVGGKKQGIAHADSWDSDLTIDLEKFFGYSDLLFYTSFIVRGGSNLSATTIDNQFPVAEVYGGETWRLNELYFKKSFLKDHLHIKFGRLNGGNDFLKSPLYCYFVSNAICGNPIAVFFNTPFFAYPFASWGVYLDIQIKNVLGKFAVYNANPNIKSNGAHGCNFSFKSNNGVLFITEWAYLHNHDIDQLALPGKYSIGAYYSTGQTANFLGGISQDNYGFYILLDQILYQPSQPKTERGLKGFATFLFAPINRNEFPFFLSLGLEYQGLFPGRDQDVTSLGFAYGEYSSDLCKVETLAARRGLNGPFGNQPQNFESVIELNHDFQVNKKFSVTLDFQYIINPKGYGEIPNAIVLGTQLLLIF